MHTFLIIMISAAFTSAQFAYRFSRYLPYNPYPHKPSKDKDLGSPLILTPVIESGPDGPQKAQKLAKVNLPEFLNVTSYSGYFNVNEERDANMFFWFFPSENNYAEDPVILWLQGGAGTSSLLGLFTENGPFIVKSNVVSLREYSWHKNYSLLYIDQPIGVGFSFSTVLGNTPANQIGDELYSALVQFFKMFPELQTLEFYIAGEGYAGKYIPTIGHTIHTRNPNASIKINLKGLMIGNGFVDPINQIKYADPLYNLGLIDRNLYNKISEAEKYIQELIKEESFYEATEVLEAVQQSLLKHDVDLPDINNFLKGSDDLCFDWQIFIVQDHVRQALHVGSSEYTTQNNPVMHGLFDDITRSVEPLLRELIIDNYYSVLIYTGHLDIEVGYAGTANYLKNFEDSDTRWELRNQWTIGKKLVGYYKSYFPWGVHLVDVLVMGAGQMVPRDQPEAAFIMIDKFIKKLF